jgi:GT2 family glycosyltransferase
MAELPHEVIVVDNASNDGSPEAVAENFREVRLVQTGSNLGFSRANNIGIRESHGRYLFLINSDVVLLPGCAQRLLAFMEQNPRTGLVGPRLLNADRSYQPSCRNMPTLGRHIARALFLNSSLADQAYLGENAKPVEVLAGSFWATRRDAVDVVGNLDERFFFYAEDLDWCLRFARAGWHIMYVPQAEAIHYGGGSSSRESARFSAQLHRAALQFWRKHYSSPVVSLYLVVSVLHSALRLLMYSIASLVPGSRRELALGKREMHLNAVRWILSGAH